MLSCSFLFYFYNAYFIIILAISYIAFSRSHWLCSLRLQHEGLLAKHKRKKWASENMTSRFSGSGDFCSRVPALLSEMHSNRIRSNSNSIRVTYILMTRHCFGFFFSPIFHSCLPKSGAPLLCSPLYIRTYREKSSSHCLSGSQKYIYNKMHEIR